jgi:pimeloyl-ACP methyl ester carboxylesterase
VDAAYTFADHVGDLIALLNELRLPPGVLLGHSMGGAHVAAAARDRFDLVLPAVREFLSRLVANEERPARPLR